MPPDYSKYSYTELLEAKLSVDANKYPEAARKINEELMILSSRFPVSVPIPTSDCLNEKKDAPVGFLGKIKDFLFDRPPLKIYDNIEVHARVDKDGWFRASVVSASLQDVKGVLEFVLEGECRDGDGVMDYAGIRISASNIKILRSILDEFENDIEAYTKND